MPSKNPKIVFIVDPPLYQRYLDFKKKHIAIQFPETLKKLLVLFMDKVDHDEQITDDTTRTSENQASE